MQKLKKSDVTVEVNINDVIAVMYTIQDMWVPELYITRETVIDKAVDSYVLLRQTVLL